MPTGGSETGMTGLCSHFIDHILSRVGSLFKVIQTTTEEGDSQVLVLSQCLVTSHRRVKIIFAGICVRGKDGNSAKRESLALPDRLVL